MLEEETHLQRLDVIEELFLDLADATPSVREQSLTPIAREHPDRYAQVMHLLRAHDRVEEHTGFLAPAPHHEGLFSTSKSAEDPNIDRRIGPYQIRRLLGRGGFGNVYLALRRNDYQQQVAIKMLRAEIDRGGAAPVRFEFERQLLADLEHENIARLLDGGTLTESGCPYIVMEYVRGAPITDYCDSRKLSINERLTIFRQVLRVVAYAHSRGVIHRDLKPSNILVTDDGRVKLLDFGIAKMLDPLDHAASALVEGRGPLTPQYASPEQVRGERVSTVSDVYSLGVILYQLLTGRRPYELAQIESHEVERIISQSIPPVPSQLVLSPPVAYPLSESDITMSVESIAAQRDSTPQSLSKYLRGNLEAIISVALNKLPNKRYMTVDAFSKDLERFQQHRPVVARPISTSEQARLWFRRNRALGGFIATSISALLLFATWGTREVILTREVRFQLSENLQKTAKLNAARGNWEQSLEQLERAADLGSRDPVRLALDRVRTFESLGQSGEAGRELEQLSLRTDLSEHEAEVRYLQGMAILPKQGLEVATPVLMQAKALGELSEADEAIVDGMLALTSDVALDNFRRAVLADPYAHEARRFLVHILTVFGQLSEARQQADAAQAFFPQDPGFVLQKAYIAALVGDQAEVQKQLRSENLKQLDSRIVKGYGGTLDSFQQLLKDQVDYWDFSRIAGARDALVNSKLKDLNQFDQSDFYQLSPSEGQDGESIVGRIESIAKLINPDRGELSLESGELILSTGPKCLQIAYEPLFRMYSLRTRGFLREGKASAGKKSTAEIDRLIDRLLVSCEAHPEGFLLFVRGQLLFVRARYEEATEAFALASQQTSAFGDYRTPASLAAACSAFQEFTQGRQDSLLQAVRHMRTRLKGPPLKRHHAEALYGIAFAGEDYQSARKLLTVLAGNEKPEQLLVLRWAQVEQGDGNYIKAIHWLDKIEKSSYVYHQALSIRSECQKKLEESSPAKSAK